jgi:hypothetical protein
MAFFGKEQTAIAEALPPRLPTAPKRLTPRVDRDLIAEETIAEYRTLAKEIGLSDQDMLVEEYRLFLAKHDIPTFNFQEVVSYMDEIAASDNPTKLGWHWCPVREKDADVVMSFGRPSREEQFVTNDQIERRQSVASDYYESHRFAYIRGSYRGELPASFDWRTMRSPAYSRTIPLHALKKIALVEREFKGGQVVFLVTDYTIAPHVIVNPDPFLMAVIPNSAVAHGKGRFIIDVWDEPGFGIDRMIR